MIDNNELIQNLKDHSVNRAHFTADVRETFGKAADALEAQAREIVDIKLALEIEVLRRQGYKNERDTLRAQLAALQCEDELPELPSPSELNGASNSVMGFTEADLKAYARQAQAMVRAKMVPLTDEVAEAMRKQFVKLPRYSFLLDDGGNVRRVQIKTGNWVEFTKAHELFDPVNVDAAIARKPLTDDQIYELYSEPSSDAEMVAFARAIESAHGITGESK